MFSRKGAKPQRKAEEISLRLCAFARETSLITRRSLLIDSYVLYARNKQCRKQHAAAADQHDIKRAVWIVLAENTANDRAKRQRLRDLGDNNEEIEDAHVNAHASRR